MSEDLLRKALREFDAGRAAKPRVPDNLTDLLGSLHRDPPLRSWVTLESRPLIPFVERIEAAGDEAAARVHVLLTVPTGAGVQRPWAYVSWAWPEARVLAMVDIRGCRLFDKEEAELTEEHLSTARVLDTIQIALDRGDAMPPLPRPVAEIYRAVFRTSLADCGLPAARIHGHASPPRSRRTELPTRLPRPLVAVEQVPELMTRARQVLGDGDGSPLALEWQRIRARMNAPQFSVVVVGEVLRGKTTLVNQLLGRALLPVGDVPTTASVTRILFGPEDAASRLLPDGRRERVELSDLGKLAADENGNDKTGVLLLQVDDDWLRRYGIQLIDTPGVDDIVGHRAALTTEAISGADAALVTISATMPLSLTERAFIDQHVLSHAVPHLAVVVTRLDQVRESDRLNVLAHLRAKLSEWAPGAKLWTTHGEGTLPQAAPIDGSGLEAIREGVANWATSHDQCQRRIDQVVFQLGTLLARFRALLEGQRGLLNLAQGDAEKAQDEAKRLLGREQLAWEDLCLALEGRELSQERWLTDRLSRATPDITEKICYELRSAAQPADWWGRELPFMLRREFMELGRTLEGELQQRIAADAGWLVGEANKGLAWNLRLGRPDALLDTPWQAQPMEQELENLSRQRLLMRLALLGTTAAAYALFGPLGIVVSAGAGVLADRTIGASINEQKRLLEAEASKVVTATLESAGQQILRRLRETYGRMVKDTREQEETWRAARQRAVDLVGSDADKSCQLEAVNGKLAVLEALEVDLGTRKPMRRDHR